MLVINFQTLSNPHVRLEPLEERHRAALAQAGGDPAIWSFQPFNIAEGFDRYFDARMADLRAGTWLIFAVLDPSGRVVGQTCYLDMRPNDHGLEIGGTWYMQAAQGTRINPAAKLLLLAHAFASGIVRVQFKTDAVNARSRAAIAKLGAQHEGEFRKYRLRPDGTWRNSVFYSITDSEWPAVRARLEARLTT